MTELGVIVRVPIIGGVDGEVLFYTVCANGHHIRHPGHHVFFQVPGWAYTRAASQPVGETHVPGLTDGIKRLLHAGGMTEAIVTHLQRFRSVAQKSLLAKDEMLGKLYNRFRQLGRLEFITTEMAARYVFELDDMKGKPRVAPTPAELYTCHLHLSKTKHYHLNGSPEQIRHNGNFRMRSEKELSRIAWLFKDLNKGAPRPCKLKYWKQAEARIAWALSLPLVDCLNPDGTLRAEPPTYFPPQTSFDVNDVTYNNILRMVTFSNSDQNNPFTFMVQKVLLQKLVYKGGQNQNMSAGRQMQDLVQFMKDLGLLYIWENTAMLPSPRDPNGIIPSLEGHGLNAWADPAVAYMKQWSEVLLAGPEIKFEPTSTKLIPSDAQPDPKLIKRLQFTSAGEKSGDVTTKLRSCAVFPLEPVQDSFHLTDACQSIRKDFGDLPVYVIDSPTAKELDDGISFERRDDGDWIHVHIADPTAYIPVSHPLAMLAQLRGSSVYLPERHYPLMPDVLSDERMSLGASQCALTFSAKIGSDGDISDFEVRPSVVRSVKIMHYRNVNNVVGWDGVYGVGLPKEARSMWVDRALEQLMVKGGLDGPEVAEADKANLKRLREVTRRHMMGRVRNGGFLSDQPGLGISLNPYPLPTDSTSPSEPVSNIKHNPTITLDTSEMQHVEPASGLVSECMIIAGRVASKFCQEFNVPAVYRGQQSVFSRSPPPTATPDIEQALSSIDPASGVMPFKSFRKILPYFSPASFSLDPSDHFSMGIQSSGSFSGYVKVTSPLRRYTDMMMHWSIKAKLLDQKMPFRKEDVLAISTRLLDLEKRAKRLSTASNRHWTLEWIRRREVLWRAGARKTLLDACSMPPTGYGPRQATVWGDSQRVFRSSYLEPPNVNQREWEVAKSKRSARPFYWVLVTGVKVRKDGSVDCVGMLADLGGTMCSVKVGNEDAGVAVGGEPLKCFVNTVDSVTGTLLMELART
ncbi:hypothetical protein HDU67_005599 [Dinochytrium kinnereticum]|nr:hypothetical protein HDU67_005599 [Dinochytrium kinnereticum]